MIAANKFPRAPLVMLFTLFVFVNFTGCSKFDLLNATIPSNGYNRTGNISYGPLQRQKLDVYRPRGASSPAGIVIFFYGGDWQTGSKEDYRFVAQALTSRGFAAVLPDYRLFPCVTFPSFVEDGALAVKWVHEHASCIGGDPSRVYLMGHSAGAHIAALLTLDAHYLHDVGIDRSAVRATAALSGPYDFVPPIEDRAVFEMKPGQVKPDADAQPISFVSGDEPPMLLVHGLRDRTVESGNAARLAGRIRERGGDVSAIYYPRKGHVSVVLSLAWPFRWLAPTLNNVMHFFHEMDRDRCSAEQVTPTTPTQ